MFANCSEQEHNSHYRHCVFCHDELVCKMASDPEQLSTSLAATCFQDMLTMVEQEKVQRQVLLEGGVRRAEREAFELLPEEERQCSICNTICFISALAYVHQMDDQDIVCIHHFPDMTTNPGSLVLKYRYTLDELAAMLQGLKNRAESPNTWILRVTKALQAKDEDRVEFGTLKAMLEEAKEEEYPESEVLDVLQETIEDVEKHEEVAKQICNKRGGSGTVFNLTVEELKLFFSQLEALPAKVASEDSVRGLLDKVLVFQAEASHLLEEEDHVELEQVERLIEKGELLEIEMVEIDHLRARADQLAWCNEVAELLTKKVRTLCWLCMNVSVLSISGEQRQCSDLGKFWLATSTSPNGGSRSIQPCRPPHNS